MHHNFKVLSKKEYIGVSTKTDKRYFSSFLLFVRSEKNGSSEYIFNSSGRVEFYLGKATCHLPGIGFLIVNTSILSGMRFRSLPLIQSIIECMLIFRGAPPFPANVRVIDLGIINILIENSLMTSKRSFI